MWIQFHFSAVACPTGTHATLPSTNAASAPRTLLARSLATSPAALSVRHPPPPNPHRGRPLRKNRDAASGRATHRPRGSKQERPSPRLPMGAMGQRQPKLRAAKLTFLGEPNASPAKRARPQEGSAAKEPMPPPPLPPRAKRRAGAEVVVHALKKSMMGTRIYRKIRTQTAHQNSVLSFFLSFRALAESIFPGEAIEGISTYDTRSDPVSVITGSVTF